MQSPDFTTVIVCYNHGGSGYTFKAARSLNLTHGDLVVVPCKGGWGYQVAQANVVHAEPLINPNALFEYKWITQKVNTENTTDGTTKPTNA